jgi:protein lifeguard
MGPFLFGGLMALVATGFVGIFVPFNSTIDLVYAAGGCLIFSGYIVYDTYLINKKLSPDEYIMGAISLYLDFLNLCECTLTHSADRYLYSYGYYSVLSILRVLNNVNDR